MSNFSYNSHGKLLLTAEYFVLDGARALAVPTVLGQNLHVTSDAEMNAKTLHWRSLDEQGACWCDVIFDTHDFHIKHQEIGENQHAERLQILLQTARDHAPDFLSGATGVLAQTKLDFPLDWGLGSSSTLIDLIAQWADVSSFDIMKNSFGAAGSGYDIACASATGAILYQKQAGRPVVENVSFAPPFLNQLYCVHLNTKQDTRKAITHYRDTATTAQKERAIPQIENITNRILNAQTLDVFENCLTEHEKITADVLGRAPIQQESFADYWGCVKSLGAWGGDFALVTSNRDVQETKSYFVERGHNVILSFQGLVLSAQSTEGLKNKGEKIS